MTRIILPAALISAMAAPALAQSLLVRPATGVGAAPTTPGEERPPSFIALNQASMMAIEAPKPREFNVHDLVTIIIEESSRQEAEQSLETDKQYDLSAALAQFPDLKKLLQGELTNGIDATPRLDLRHDQSFSGDGKYEREDRFTARITAEVIDVKPNGVLVLEARKHIEKDREKQTLIIAGACRGEDVTRNNTILSSQMADLTLAVKNEGDVKKAGKKGAIPRVLESLFAF